MLILTWINLLNILNYGRLLGKFKVLFHSNRYIANIVKVYNFIYLFRRIITMNGKISKKKQNKKKKKNL